MAPDSTKLNNLFDLVTDAFIDKVRGGEQTIVNKDGDEVTVQLKPTAAELAAAVTFLKNNNITATPADDNKLGELEAMVKERAERRRARMSRAVAADMPDGYSGVGVH